MKKKCVPCEGGIAPLTPGQYESFLRQELRDWNKLKLSLTTFAVSGLSENDFILASEIDALQ